MPPAAAISTSTANYRVLELLGRGGMGEVYRGRHDLLGRDVAIKFLAADADSDRFLREARIAAQVKSPHAVSVFDCHVLPDGKPVIIMEFVPGRSLADILTAETVVSCGDLARYMVHAAIGMTAVAQVGVVHRDLKPGNLLIGGDGNLRIADFGIARIDALAADASVSTVMATKPGSIFGTPHYMSPEQAEDTHAADVRSDVYSYGASFYHAATGRPPFEGPSAFSILLKHRTETPKSPNARRPELPSRLNDVLERCLAKTPSDRFQSFEQVQAALVDPDVSPWEESFDPRIRGFLQRYLADRNRLLEPTGASGEIARYQFPNMRELRLTRGDLSLATADAIVSSDDERLSMGGGVSHALNARSGFVLAAEVKKYGRVRHGGVVVTSAGSLNAAFVLHGVTIEYQPLVTLPATRDIVLQILRGCFYHANTLVLRSLAMPLLGTGAAGLSPSVCLDTMVGYLIRTLLIGTHSVDRVEIVLHPMRRRE